MTIYDVPLRDISFLRTETRAALDPDTIQKYAAEYRAGRDVGLIVLFYDGTDRHIADGTHRVRAAQSIGKTTLFAEVHDGTWLDALWYAVGSHRAQGQKRNESDLRHAIKLAVLNFPERSGREIARHIGCSHKYVLKIKHLTDQVDQVATSPHVIHPSPKRVTGRDGKRYPSAVADAAAPHHKHDEVMRLAKAGLSDRAIRYTAHVGTTVVAAVRDELAGSAPRAPKYDKSKASVAARRDTMRTMADNGATSIQIAAAVGMTVEGTRTLMRQLGIRVQADVMTRNTRQPEPNRIIERIVLAAGDLTEGINLVDFGVLDRTRVPDWVRGLEDARSTLAALIRRLTKEQKNGEAA